MKEIITAGGVKCTATNVSTGLNTISFTLFDMTVDEAEAVFKNVESLMVSDEQDNVYGEYPNVAYESVTKDADENVSVSMHILTHDQVQIRELQVIAAEHDAAIAAMMFGGEE